MRFKNGIKFAIMGIAAAAGMGFGKIDIKS